MILPSKQIPPEQSILVVGSELIQSLDTPRTLSSLWDVVRGSKGISSFDKFSLALCFLYGVGLIELDGPLVRRRA